MVEASLVLGANAGRQAQFRLPAFFVRARVLADGKAAACREWLQMRKFYRMEMKICKANMENGIARGEWQERVMMGAKRHLEGKPKDSVKRFEAYAERKAEWVFATRTQRERREFALEMVKFAIGRLDAGRKFEDMKAPFYATVAEFASDYGRHAVAYEAYLMAAGSSGNESAREDYARKALRHYDSQCHNVETAHWVKVDAVPENFKEMVAAFFLGPKKVWKIEFVPRMPLIEKVKEDFAKIAEKAGIAMDYVKHLIASMKEFVSEDHRF